MLVVNCISMHGCMLVLADAAGTLSAKASFFRVYFNVQNVIQCQIDHKANWYDARDAKSTTDMTALVQGCVRSVGIKKVQLPGDVMVLTREEARLEMMVTNPRGTLVMTVMQMIQWQQPFVPKQP